MAKSKHVWASTYRSTEVKDGELVRTVARPGDDVTGLDSDTKSDYEERGLIVSRKDFESDEDDESSVVKVQEAGTAKAQSASSDES